MKKIIIVVFTVTTVLSLAFAANNKQKQPIVSVPEVIECEHQGTCKMTRIDVLLQLEKKKL